MPIIPDELKSLARRQDGLVTRRQALDNGLTEGRIDRLAAPGGRWQRVLRGVYALTTGTLTRRQQLRAVLLYAGPQAVLTGTTTLEVMEFRYAPRDPRVHVLVPRHRRVSPQPVLVVQRTARMPEARRIDGFPNSPSARAVVDACRGLTHARDVVAVLAEAVQREHCTIDALRDEVDAGSTRGAASVRRALRDLSRGAWSAPETDLLQVVQHSSLLPPPQVNHLITVNGRRYLADACWPEARLVVEVDSVEHHGLATSLEQTARRRAALTSAGWTVLSISPARLRHEADEVLREIEAAYLAGVVRQTG